MEARDSCCGSRWKEIELRCGACGRLMRGSGFRVEVEHQLTAVKEGRKREVAWVMTEEGAVLLCSRCMCRVCDDGARLRYA